MVEEVEGLDAGFCRETFGEFEYPLQAHIGVEIGRTTIRIATDRSGSVGEWKAVAVHIESREDREVAWTLNRVQQRYFEVAQRRRPLRRTVSQDRENEAVANIVVANR